VPGGALLLTEAVLLHRHWLVLPLPTVSFAYYAALMGGFLLTWRFHSSRVFSALATLFMVQQTQQLFFHSGSLDSGSASLLAQAVVSIAACNFVALSLFRERGFTSAGFGLLFTVLCFEAAPVLMISTRVAHLPVGRHHLFHPDHIILGYGWLAFALAALILLTRFLILRKPIDLGLFWSLAALLGAVYFQKSATISFAYSATSALVLGFSLVETSYLLAYEDELTALPSRRAFHEALERLQTPYVIAVVDVDHFKQVNDTYGHDIGDEVLRLVASRLYRVSGGGTAFRSGGEEFPIVFPGRSENEVVEHLEHLRSEIEGASFRLRGGDRRQLPRGPDRRSKRPRAQKHSQPKFASGKNSAGRLSVTVSIGVAGSAGEMVTPERVLRAADQALYRAKEAGRNRVETAGNLRRKSRTKTAGIA
jgi:GGDEF domain-containing protein